MSKTALDKGDCVCICGLKFKESNKKCPDHLKNWELWMQRRRKIHNLLGKLGRGPGELLMNAGEEYRIVKEDNLMLSYTKIETRFDKLRGNPAFWKLPTSLKSRVEPYGTTEYFTTPTKEEKNEIPVIEYVGVADYVLKEKDVIPRTRNIYNLWKNNTYRKEVIQRMSSKVSQIEPHRPDYRSLVIIGEKIVPKITSEATSPPSPPTPPPPPPPSRQSEIFPVTKSCVGKILAKGSKIKSLRIDNLQFDEGSTPYLHSKISVLFEYFTDLKVPCEKFVTIENTGKIALRLYWKQYNKLKIFREYTTELKIFHPFIFDKNDILLLPGQKLDFSFQFKVNKPGNYFESWELNTLPKIWDENVYLVIELKGFAFIKRYDECCSMLIPNLNQRIRATVVKDLISDIISKGNYCSQSVLRSYDFNEKELFESKNLKENICLRTPKYMYDKKIIDELKEFYQEVKQPDDPDVWNLSIKTLKEVSRKKDLFLYFQQTMAAFNTAKMNRMLLLDNIEQQKTTQPKINKTAVGKSVGKTRKDSGQNAEADQIQTLSYYNDLKHIIQKLEKPSAIANDDRKKYLLSYIIIRTYLFKMFDQLYLIDNEKDITIYKDPIREEAVSEKTKSDSNILVEMAKSLQISSIQDRLFYEKFNESYILRTKRVPHEAVFFAANPKSALLTDISLSDPKKIWKIYFNKEETREKGQKKKSQSTEKTNKKISPKKSDKSKKSANKDQEDLYLDIIENFEPFFGELSSDQESTDKLNTYTKLNDESTTEIQNYEEKYLIIYNSLSNAIDDLVETVDGLKDRNISSSILGELQKCVTSSINLAHDETLEQSMVIKSTEDNLSEKRESDVSNNEYFNFLLASHWENNMKTKQYFVKEINKTMYNNGYVEEQQICEIKDTFETLSNAFSLEDFQRKLEPFGTKDAEVQNSLMSLKSFENVSFEEQSSIHSSLRNLGGSSSRNIFYFLDNIYEKESSDVNKNDHQS